MQQHIKIAVLGGGGRTGNYLVRLLAQKGYALKLLLRHPKNFSLENPLIEMVKRDALDIKIIAELLKDAQVVISTIGQRPGEPLVAESVTKSVLEVMDKYGIKRYIVLGGINIDTPFDQKGPTTLQATQWMKANFPQIQEDRQKAYDLLASSTVDWTLVRVPFIEFTDSTKIELKINLQDCLGTKVSAQHIADFMVNQITDDTYIRASPFIAD